VNYFSQDNFLTKHATALCHKLIYHSKVLL